MSGHHYFSLQWSGLRITSENFPEITTGNLKDFSSIYSLPSKTYFGSMLKHQKEILKIHLSGQREPSKMHMIFHT